MRRRTWRYVEQAQAEGQRRYTLEDELALLVFGDFSIFGHLLRNKRHDGRKEKDDSETESDRRDGTGKERDETPLGHEERLSEIKVEHGTQYKGKHEGRALIVELPEQISEDAENNHNYDVKYAVIHAVSAYQAEKQNKRIEELCRNLQDLNPHRDQRKIQYQQHNVPQVHAAYHAPEEIRMLF